MSLPSSPSHPPYDWEEESDCEYETVPPPASIERCRVDEILDQPHQDRFCRAIRNILHSKPAELTFAQLVDGLPLKKVATSTAAVQFHNAVIEHEALCPGAMDKARSFRDNFDPASLDLPVDVLKRYQYIPAGSRASKLPFIELVAVAIHRIAVLVYKQGSIHKEKGLPAEEDRLCHAPHYGPDPPLQYHPTPFCLCDYADAEQYPDGVADVAGYWAENWIFGGVVVFSRGESGIECNDVWLHSLKENTTHRVWSLTDDQVSRLLGFLESAEETPSDCPLPIKLEKTNQRRIDADNCIPEHNIYRDRWERKMRFSCRSDWDFSRRGMCVDIEVNFPKSEDDSDLA